MKILDEKGRLFGKINLIDLIVILLALALVAAVGWKLAGDKIVETIQTSATVYEYKVFCPAVNPMVSEYAQTCIGDQLLAGGELLDGNITGVVSTPYYETSVDEEGNVTKVENPLFNNLTVTIRCRPKEVSGSLSIGTQELRVGKPHIVKSTRLEINNAVILWMEEVHE